MLTCSCKTLALSAFVGSQPLCSLAHPHSPSRYPWAFLGVVSLMIKNGPFMFSWCRLLLISFTHDILEGGYPAAGTLHGTLLSWLGCCFLKFLPANCPDITMLTKCIGGVLGPQYTGMILLCLEHHRYSCDNSSFTSACAPVIGKAQLEIWHLESSLFPYFQYLSTGRGPTFSPCRTLSPHAT